MLHIFSINLVKVVTRKPKTTNNKGHRSMSICANDASIFFFGNSWGKWARSVKKRTAEDAKAGARLG